MEKEYIAQQALRALMMVNEAIEENKKLRYQLELILEYLERKETNK